MWKEVDWPEDRVGRYRGQLAYTYTNYCLVSSPEYPTGIGTAPLMFQNSFVPRWRREGPWVFSDVFKVHERVRYCIATIPNRERITKPGSLALLDNRFRSLCEDRETDFPNRQQLNVLLRVIKHWIPHSRYSLDGIHHDID